MMRAVLALVSWLPWSLAQADGPATRLAVYKPVGSLQCEGGGMSAEAMRAELSAAGVRVLATTCGDDGAMRASQCGTPDGAIRIFEIPGHQREAAGKAGYRPLSALPDARRRPCR